MKDGFRQSMAWLHTWAGLCAGWLLFFVFLTGTIGYFDTELDRWMRPEAPLASAPVPQADALATAEARLERVAPNATQWIIYPPSGRDVPNISIFWVDPQARPAGRSSDVLDPATGDAIVARATGGGQTLYQMHYLLRYLPSGLAYWLVGVCAMLMLVAIVSGVVTHKRIFRDFFRLRLGRGQRSWLDLHNVLGVLALPFHLMITYSGLVFFAFTYMSLVVAATYGAGNEARQRFFDEAFDSPVIPAPAGVAAGHAPLAGMLAAAERAWGPDPLRSIDVRNRGDANARVVLTRRHVTPVSNGGRMVFDGASGELLEAYDRRRGPAAVNDALLGLHEGLFAGPMLRWLYFLSGVLGTAMVAAGLVVWTAKRRQSHAGRAGLALVERLNVGTIAGLPIAVGAYLWANRLLPAGLSGRADWEVNVLFIVWAALLVHAFLRPVRRGWLEQCVVGALVFFLLPVVNALTTERHLGVSLPAGDWTLAGVDLAALAVGVACGCAGWLLRRPCRIARSRAAARSQRAARVRAA